MESTTLNADRKWINNITERIWHSDSDSNSRLTLSNVQAQFSAVLFIHNTINLQHSKPSYLNNTKWFKQYSKIDIFKYGISSTISAQASFSGALYWWVESEWVSHGGVEKDQGGSFAEYEILLLLSYTQKPTYTKQSASGIGKINKYKMRTP